MIKFNEEIIVDTEGEEVFCFDSKNNRCIRVNDIGQEILKTVNKKKKVEIEEILSFVCDNYAVDKKVANDDLREFVKGLINEGDLVEE